MLDMSYILDRLIILPGILLGISVHEFSHGYAAYKMGDDTPLLQGRLTINPIKHIDPMGFMCLLIFGFGWAKPVMINSRNFKNPRRDDIIVSVAGCVANFITAFIFVGLMKFISVFFQATTLTTIILSIFSGVVSINLVLMVFNLLPIPPLDGHHVLGDIFGAPVWNFYHKYYDQLRFVMLIMIFFGIINKVIFPFVVLFENLLFGIFF